MKGVFFVALLAFAFCADGPLFDYTALLKSAMLKGAKIELSLCMEETHFKITRTTVYPEEIIKGDDIAFKAQGQALEDLVIKNLHLVTKYNGADIFIDDKDQGMHEVPAGKTHSFAYTASVPSFTPSGSWDIYLYLQNDKDENISCLLAHFDME